MMDTRNSKTTSIVHDWPKQAIAITGTIGSGKSTALEILRKQGAFVVSADELSREVVAPGTPGLKKILDTFGAEFVKPDGTLNREALGRRVFASPEDRKKLEGIVHPFIKERAAELFSAAIHEGKKFLVYEVPLLFEAGLDKLGFKKVVVVTASDEKCVERIVKRSGGRLSEEEARARIKSQFPRDEKVKRADIVVDNGSTIEALEQSLKTIS